MMEATIILLLVAKKEEEFMRVTFFENPCKFSFEDLENSTRGFIWKTVIAVGIPSSAGYHLSQGLENGYMSGLLSPDKR